MVGLAVQVTYALAFLFDAGQEVGALLSQVDWNVLTDRMSQLRPSILKFPFSGFYAMSFCLLGAATVALLWFTGAREALGAQDRAERGDR